jgi:hypothetical protein
MGRAGERCLWSEEGTEERENRGEGRGGSRDDNGQGRVRVKHLPTRWHTRLSLLYPYPSNVTGKNTYPYPYP